MSASLYHKTSQCWHNGHMSKLAAGADTEVTHGPPAWPPTCQGGSSYCCHPASHRDQGWALDTAPFIEETNWSLGDKLTTPDILRKIPGKPSKSTAMAWVRSLVGELRSPQTVWRSKKKKKQVWLEKCTNKCNLNRYCQLFYKKALILPISTNNIWESPPHILANTRHYHFKNFLKNRFKVISHSYFNLYFPDIVFLCVYWLLHFFLLWIICSYLLPNFLLVSYSLLP